MSEVTDSGLVAFGSNAGYCDFARDVLSIHLFTEDWSANCELRSTKDEHSTACRAQRSPAPACLLCSRFYRVVEQKKIIGPMSLVHFKE